MDSFVAINEHQVPARLLDRGAAKRSGVEHDPRHGRRDQRWFIRRCWSEQLLGLEDRSSASLDPQGADVLGNNELSFGKPTVDHNVFNSTIPNKEQRTCDGVFDEAGKRVRHR